MKQLYPVRPKKYENLHDDKIRENPYAQKDKNAPPEII